MIRKRLTIIDASRELGLQPWTLRRLHRLGRLPEPRRDALAGNSRIYTTEDVERMRERLSELERENAAALK